MTAAALGWIHVPAAAAEAAIALSLVLVAIDVGRRDVSARAGATTAFVFGAVHGLGFAGGLQELGVARDHPLDRALLRKLLSRRADQGGDPRIRRVRERPIERGESATDMRGIPALPVLFEQ